MTKEHDLINCFFAPLCSKPLSPPAYGLMDDAALLPGSGESGQIVTTDMLVAGKHFFADDAPADIAHKALAVNVSDMVAKGGLPQFYLLSIALSESCSTSWVEEFSKGLLVSQQVYGCQLVGGDTVSTEGPLTINITLMGQAACDKGPLMITRSGAQQDDIVFVTGNIGDAALGLLLRFDDERLAWIDLDPASAQHLGQSYLRPSPNIALAPLIGGYASAAMDISDGLVGDFTKLCAASKVGGELRQSAIPLSGPARKILAKVPALVETVLCGGDDYHVLLTVPPQRADKFEQQVRKYTNTPAKAIGTILEISKGVKVIDKEGQVLHLRQSAYDHLANME